MSWLNRKKKHDPLVRVIDLADDKLEPDSQYLLVFNKSQINIRDCQNIAKGLHQNHIKASVVMVDGDVRSAVKAYSIPEEQIVFVPDPATATDLNNFIDDMNEEIEKEESTEPKEAMEYQEIPIKNIKVNATETVQE